MGNSLRPRICQDVTFYSDELDFFQYYRTGEIIGTGAFGQVLECMAADEDDGAVYAVKVIDKDPVILQTNSAYLQAMLESSFSQSSFEASTRRLKVQDEVAILKQIRHPCIVDLLDVFENERCVYVVMEKIDGGQLFDRLSQDMSQVFESDVANVAAQMFSAIEYLHNVGIVHRDVKAENILLVDGAPERKEANREETGGAFGAIKLIDFGFACVVQPSSSSCALKPFFKGSRNEAPLTYFCGSPPYVAPEIFEGNYGKKVDVWAAGVVLYLMLFAQYPYYSDFDPEETTRLICSGEPPAFKCHWIRDWTPSSMVQKFLLLLFQKDVEKRPDASGALRYSWIQNGGCEEDESVSPEVPMDVRMHLGKFATVPSSQHEEKTPEHAFPGAFPVQKGRHVAHIIRPCPVGPYLGIRSRHAMSGAEIYAGTLVQTAT